MKSFHTIAVPHKDILEGRLTMDVFAADLWEVMKNEGPDEYKDAETFFRKTYLTEGLKNLLAIIEKRIHGKGGDPVIQIQTPFGGGKTHTLIAMYHKAKEWRVNTVTIVGEKMKTGNKPEDFDTIWGIIEEQLTGSKTEFSSPIPPGGEQLKKFLEKQSPVLILIDELIAYLNITDAISVGRTDITALTLNFLNNLVNVVSEMENIALVFTTTPSNPYNRTPRGEEIIIQLRNITGRREIIKSPIQDQEISKIIRRRLFNNIDESMAKKVITQFVNYADEEGILPKDIQPSEYRDRFLDSYPFMPEVIDILYHRWGSFPIFQRTRGVLRLLSLVVYCLMGTNKSYISLADFDLSNQEIRQEFIRHIGEEYNGIIDVDITGIDANSKKIDKLLSSSYQGLNLGIRVANTIFLYSFSGGHEYGVTLNEIKRSATTIENPSEVIADAFQKLTGESGSLFYIHSRGEKYFFNTQPNINKIIYINKENIRDEELITMESELLRENLNGKKLKIFIWEEKTENIPDSEELKLVILKSKNQKLMDSILKTKGQTSRVYRNTIFFLYPLESERSNFINIVKNKIAYDYIEKDKNLNLSEEQRKDIKKALKKAESELKESICRFYRAVSIPEKDKFKEIILGVPIFGEDISLDQKMYDSLRSNSEILEKTSPLFLKEKYLSSREYVSIEQIYQTFLKTPGEVRPVNKKVFEEGIIAGVRIGQFGLGELENNTPICRYFKEEMPAEMFFGNEIIINQEMCQKQKEVGISTGISPYPSGESGEKPTIDETSKEEGKEISVTPTIGKHAKGKVYLKFKIPKGHIYDILRLMNLLQTKFNTLEIELTAKDGSISEQDYENTIKETFRQLDIDVDENDGGF